MMVVLSAYKQIRTQTGDVLSTAEEDNYDRAFDFYRPSKYYPLFSCPCAKFHQ